MKKIKTHTFRLGKYYIEFTDRIDGVTDTPDETSWEKCRHDMLLLNGGDLKALNSALHEAMHAEKIPDEYLHDKEGYSDTERIAKFLWRLGWRKQ